MPPIVENVFYINFFDKIDEAKVRALMGVCANIIAQKSPDRLYFLFSTPGGQVNAGITLHNYLRSLPVKLTMHNTGAIDSIGNVIFASADERFAAPIYLFLFHGIAMGVPQGANLGSANLQKR